MPSKQRYCPRCGNVGVQSDSATEELWYCRQHGLIYKALHDSSAEKEQPALSAGTQKAKEPEEEDEPTKKTNHQFAKHK